MERTEPAFVADEKQMLCGWMDFHRATILMKLEGLSEDDARRVLVSSGTNLLGMVRHLAFAEDYWFSQIFAGADLDVPRVLPGEIVPADVPVSAVVSSYEAACDRSRAVVADASLDARARGTVSNRRGPASMFTLRWVLTHMIEETARHNGHADIIREQIDGSTGA
jgi:uncharacterized damage-inducible protein DinB